MHIVVTWLVIGSTLVLLFYNFVGRGAGGWYSLEGQGRVGWYSLEEQIIQQWKDAAFFV